MASKLGLGTRFFGGFKRVSLSKNTYYDRLTISCSPQNLVPTLLYWLKINPK